MPDIAMGYCHRNFCPTKKCPRIKILPWDKIFLKNFVLGQNFSENFYPTQITFVLP